MKLFSGLFGNKQSEPSAEVLDNRPPDASTPSLPLQKLADIANRLGSYSQTANLSKELWLLIDDPTTHKSQYFRVVTLLRTIAENESKKTSLYKQYLSMLNNIKTITSAEFDAKFIGFEDFFEDFPHLDEEYAVLQALHDTAPNIFSDSELEQLYSHYNILADAFKKASLESETLKGEQEELSKEIIKFSSSVEECKQKYRFSPDWEGKKPLMSSLGKKLSKKREVLMERETALNKELRILYDGYPSMHSEFIKNSDYFISLLQTNVDLYDENDMHDKTFSEIALSLEGLLRESL